MLAAASDEVIFCLDGLFGSASLRTCSRITRRSSSLLFTPDQNAVIFGDKSGNVFKLSVTCFEKNSECKSSTLLLGHLSMLSDIDSYLRCWQSRTGRQLGAFKLEFPTISGVSLEDNTRSSDCPVIVSRLTAIAPNICVGACASYLQLL
ncbi:hypothetical protein FBUS_01117 [Fasciolopsis buskii]|uniref:Uncharacterized protein n=1 Tax=Fasciolopsis buskii TaxID=27845 RepID=A0A8E0VJ72_9TREM|nr:hypothetical protein FBUS_01117 [Fasciolopsis buski]